MFLPCPCVCLCLCVPVRAVNFEADGINFFAVVDEYHIRSSLSTKVIGPSLRSKQAGGGLRMKGILFTIIIIIIVNIV